MTEIKAKNIDEEKKIKAIFVLKTKGKDLSKAVREMIDNLAKEYDEMNKKK